LVAAITRGRPRCGGAAEPLDLALRERPQRWARHTLASSCPASPPLQTPLAFPGPSRASTVFNRVDEVLAKNSDQRLSPTLFRSFRACQKEHGQPQGESRTRFWRRIGRARRQRGAAGVPPDDSLARCPPRRRSHDFAPSQPFDLSGVPRRLSSWTVPCTASRAGHVDWRQRSRFPPGP